MKLVNLLLIGAWLLIGSLEASEQTRYRDSGPTTTTGILLGEYGALYYQSIAVDSHSIRVGVRDNADYDSNDAVGMQYAYIADDWTASGAAFKAEAFEYYHANGSMTKQIGEVYVTPFVNSGVYRSDGYDSVTVSGGAYALYNLTDDIYGTVLASVGKLDASSMYFSDDVEKRIGGTVGYNNGKLRTDFSLFATETYGSSGTEVLITTSYEFKNIQAGVFYYSSTQDGVDSSVGASLAYRY